MTPALDSLAPTVVLRTLLREQLPRLETQPIRLLRTSGTEHVVLRVGEHHVARLPRDPDAAAGLLKDLAWLPRLSTCLPVEVPDVVHLGEPSDVFPFRWMINRWVDGSDAASRVLAGDMPTHWADTLAEIVTALRSVDLASVPESDRPCGSRGGRLRDRMQDLAAADAVAGRLDPSSIEPLLQAALAVEPTVTPDVLLHADLIPGNLVVRGDRIVGLLDLGTLTTGQPAWDLTPAWWVLNAQTRRRFRASLGVDAATWQHGCALAAIQGLLANWYYSPRGHALAALGARAVEQTLAPD